VPILKNIDAGKSFLNQKKSRFRYPNNGKASVNDGNTLASINRFNEIGITNHGVEWAITWVPTLENSEGSKINEGIVMEVLLELLLQG